MSSSKTSVLASALVALATVLATGCGGANDSTDDSDVGVAKSADTFVGGCYLRAWHPQYNGSGILGNGDSSHAQISCPYATNTSSVQACMWQNVNGAWSQLDWTCRSTGPFGPNGYATLDVYSAAVPYFTRGRQYKTWARACAYGVCSHTWSNVCTGDGGNGCNL
jgi:hypothetical protein